MGNEVFEKSGTYTTKDRSHYIDCAKMRGCAICGVARVDTAGRRWRMPRPLLVITKTDNENGVGRESRYGSTECVKRRMAPWALAAAGSEG